MSTIKEIARLAGVSRGTVDRVLNYRGAVKQETAEKVLRIAKAVNYTPNLAGKTLAAKKKHMKFGFILLSSAYSNPFFFDVVRGIESMRETLRDFGATVDIRFSSIENFETQLELIDELLELGINGLAITPINHPKIVEKLKKLAKSGFPIVTTNSDIPDCGRIAYVGSDYYKSGETAAGVMNMICGTHVNVGVIIGSPLVLCHSERVAGFTVRLLKAYPHIKISDSAVNNDDDQDSFVVVKTMLRKHPEINALYLAAAGVSGACNALKELGLAGKIKVVSYDATDSIRLLVREKIISATITQQSFTQGVKPLEILLDYVGMDVKPEKEFFYTKIEIKIDENI